MPSRLRILLIASEVAPFAKTGGLADVAGARFVPFSAVVAGVKEIRQVMTEAEAEGGRRGQRTILFVDEIHRFNRAQQDAFLPYVEKGLAPVLLAQQVLALETLAGRSVTRAGRATAGSALSTLSTCGQMKFRGLATRR